MAPLAPATLLALTALGAPAWACLRCFTTYKERVRVCRTFVGRGSRQVERCEQAFEDAFRGLRDVEINYDERSHLYDTFTQMTFSLEEAAHDKVSFKYAFRMAARKMEGAILQLKAAADCVPPCGFQEAARRFRCLGCYSYICDFPLDCPVQDVTVVRGRQATFSCTVNFPLPAEELSYHWKFAGGIRTNDQAYFQGSPQAGGPVARIRPVQPTHRGTFCCVIEHDKLPLARLYFFLNVTGAPPRGETELQVAFRQVVSWAPRETRVLEPWTPSLGELLARPDALTPDNQWLLAAAVACASASATLLVWMFLRWYCRGR